MLTTRVNPNDSFVDSFGQFYIFFEDASSELKIELCSRINKAATQRAQHHDEGLEVECDDDRLAKAEVEWRHVSSEEKKCIKYWWLMSIKKQFEVHGDPLRSEKTYKLYDPDRDGGASSQPMQRFASRR